MARREPVACPTEAALAVIGGKWKILILCRLHNGVSRFNELKRQVPGISQRMLTQNLRELERDEIVRRLAYADGPPKVEYMLTDFGRTLTPVLDMLYVWGEGYQERMGSRAAAKPARKLLHAA